MNRKYALCVGNNYPGTSAQLHGCVNDAHDWAELLLTQGYEVVVAEEATLQTTVDNLVDLVGRAGYGDRLVFTYSGHGTWIPDRDGDEADGRDEAMVMADYRQGGLLLDDTLQSIFSRLKVGTGALILSDSCHSGTVSRFVGPTSPPGGAKFLSPVQFIDGLTQERAVALEEKAASIPRQTSSLISGCGDLEYSYDASFDGRPNGAFSRVAIDTYTPGQSLASWFAAIRKRLPTSFYPQTPQLTSASPYRRYTKAL